MKNLFRALYTGLIAALALSGCDKESEKTFSLLIDDATPLEQGQTIDMEVGESFSVITYCGEERAQDYKWSSSDETVALVHSYGTVEALHGGEAKITMSHEDTTISFNVRIPVVEHASLYYFFRGVAYDDENQTAYWRDYFFIDGVLQDEDCNILKTDESGNIYQGYLADGKLNLKRNGVEVAKDKPVLGDIAKFVAKGGKAYLLTNEWEEFLHPGVSAHCYIVSAAGDWRDIDLDLSSYGSPAGSVSFVDEDSDGNILIWGGITQGDHWYAPLLSRIWHIDIAGNIRCHYCDYYDEAKDWYMGPFSDGALDMDDNVYYLADKQVWKAGKIDNDFFNIYRHEGKYLYKLGESSSRPNGIARSHGLEMIVRGSDIWFALCDEVSDFKYEVDIYKNGRLYLTAAKSKKEGYIGEYIDFSITPSGDLYTIYTVGSGICISKNDQLIRYQPFDNADLPSFAVKER